MAMYWGEKRYYSLDYYLKDVYGEKLYKIALNSGMTCPNRDGVLGNTGCIFCSAGGSGDFAQNPIHSVTEQIELGKSALREKYNGNGFIAYFQAYTNTYGPVSVLRKIFTEAAVHPDVRIISIATRPDCLADDIVALLRELNQIKPVWIELGLQTIHPSSAVFIRRGYDLAVFDDAVRRLRLAGLPVIVHVILGLPGEDCLQMLETIQYLNQSGIQGIKLQLLHVLRHTALAEYYSEHSFWIPSLEEYLSVLGKCISCLRPDIVVHRLTGDGPKAILVEPRWTANKRQVLNHIQHYFKSHDIWQGKELSL